MHGKTSKRLGLAISALGFVSLLGISSSVSCAAEAKSPKELSSMETAEVQHYADLGQTDAKLEMAVRYAAGKGVEKDEQRALGIVRTLAAKNNDHAQYLMGAAFANGMGVQHDDVAATRWFERSARQRNPEGEYWLGIMIGTGRAGREANWARAKPWFEKSVSHGSSNGAMMLGVMYEKGRGVPKDPDEAANWYRKAIDIDGNAQAKWNLHVLIDQKPADQRADDPLAGIAIGVNGAKKKDN